MKQFLLAIVMIMGISIGANAQTATKKVKATKHHCTAACANGKHMYAHGEKGHVCTAECMKMEKMNKEKMGDGKMDSKKESK